MKITVYSLRVCPYCDWAKVLLKQRGFDFEEILMDDWSDEQWEAQRQRNHMKTAPQIYAGDRLIGGYSDLEALDRKDHLQSLR